MTECGSFSTYALSQPVSPRAEEEGYILLHPSEPRWFAGNQTTIEIGAYLNGGIGIDEAAALLENSQIPPAKPEA
jgi:hypothetical protein